MNAVENLENEEHIDDFLSFYDKKCYFKDPFHDIQGKILLRKLFENMFKNLNNPRFIDLKIISEKDIINMSWTFVFQKKGENVQNHIHGMSWLKVNEKGLISHQRDYWDSVELFQAFKLLKLPLQYIKKIFSKAQIE